MATTVRHGKHAALWFGKADGDEGPYIAAEMLGDRSGHTTWQLRFYGNSDARSYAEAMSEKGYDVESIIDDVLRGLGTRFFASWVSEVSPALVRSQVAAAVLTETPIWKSDYYGYKWVSSPIERILEPEIEYGRTNWPEAEMRANLDVEPTVERVESEGTWL